MKSVNQRRQIEWGDVCSTVVIILICLALAAGAVAACLGLADMMMLEKDMTDHSGQIINMQSYSKQVSKSSSRMVYELYVMDGNTCVCIPVSNIRFMTLQIGQTVEYKIIQSHGKVTGWYKNTEVRLR